MNISSRTPDGDWNTCPVCGHHCKLVPACTPSRDAPCPRCGALLWFEPPAAKPYEWPLFVAKVSDLRPTFLADVEALLQPLICVPQDLAVSRDPAEQTARLVTRLLRRGTKKFGTPWFWQRWAIQKIQDSRQAERMLSLLHESRSWRALLAGWRRDQRTKGAAAGHRR